MVMAHQFVRLERERAIHVPRYCISLENSDFAFTLIKCIFVANKIRNVGFQVCGGNFEITSINLLMKEQNPPAPRVFITSMLESK